MEQISLSWEPERRIYQVGELTQAIADLLGGEFADVWVAGEISGVRLPASGHYYFILKDAEAQLRCVCFKGIARLLKVKPQDGLAALLRGRIDVYAARGEYQLLVQDLQPQGYGALQLAFEQLKRKLEAEGLFAAARKRTLPKLPHRIGIVTSPTGAVIRDMIQILSQRFPGLHIRLYPALVQGAGSVEAVVEGLEYFSSSGWAEVVILGRGGGSLEDLWTFNEEAVARAIAACTVPVISAVGHETDFTIADFVADLRAPTPSAAAEMVICTQQELLDQVTSGRNRLWQAVRYRLAQAAATLHRQGMDRAAGTLRRRIGQRQQRIDELDFRGRQATRARLAVARRRAGEVAERLRWQDLRLRLGETRRRLEATAAALAGSLSLRLAAARGRLAPLAAQVAELSPLKILARGYAVVQDAAGAIVRSSEQAPVGMDLSVRLWRGRLRVEVTGSELR